MLLRTIAIAAGLTFAAATIAPAVSSVAFARDHSHSGSSDKSGHDGNHHGDKNDKGKDRNDNNKDHKGDRKRH
jgi:hypothetical protein